MMIIAFLSIVAIFTILGNLFVILCVLLKDQLRRVRSNMFVVSLGNQYELHNDTYENHLRISIKSKIKYLLNFSLDRSSGRCDCYAFDDQ